MTFKRTLHSTPDSFFNLEWGNLRKRYAGNDMNMNNMPLTQFTLDVIQLFTQGRVSKICDWVIEIDSVSVG